MPQFCENCGTQLSNQSQFCRNCGAVIQGQLQYQPQSQYQTEPPPHQGMLHPLIGWSEKCNDPQVLRSSRKQRKAAWIFCFVLMIAFIVGFGIFGTVSDELELPTALLIGAGLALMMLIITVVRSKGQEKSVWEGTVSNKTEKKKLDQRFERNTPHYYTEYTVHFTGVNGDKRKLVSIENRAMYDYFRIGERVRFHPRFDTYEKYDKSLDSYIYCNVCSKKNDISEDVCHFCKNPLFK